MMRFLVFLNGSGFIYTKLIYWSVFIVAKIDLNINTPHYNSNSAPQIKTLHRGF
jgi:hypothetical protein